MGTRVTDDIEYMVNIWEHGRRGEPAGRSHEQWYVHVAGARCGGMGGGSREQHPISRFLVEHLRWEPHRMVACSRCCPHLQAPP